MGEHAICTVLVRNKWDSVNLNLNEYSNGSCIRGCGPLRSVMNSQHSILRVGKRIRLSSNGRNSQNNNEFSSATEVNGQQQHQQQKFFFCRRRRRKPNECADRCRTYLEPEWPRRNNQLTKNITTTHSSAEAQRQMATALSTATTFLLPSLMPSRVAQQRQ